MRKLFRAIFIIYCWTFSAVIGTSQERPRRVELLPSTTASSPRTSTASEAPEEIGEGDVLRVDTSLVTIPVSVRDRQGRFIYDLKREEFSVYENGVEQEIAFFEPMETPFTVILILATNFGTWRKHEKIKDAAMAFVNLMRPEDQMMVVSYASGVTVEAEPTSDRSALQQAIRKVGKGDIPYLYKAVDWVVEGSNSTRRGRSWEVPITAEKVQQ